MKRKGFTLIELLAVIVILAVIALITTPMIMGLIEGSRKEAFKDSVYGAFRQLDYYLLEKEQSLTRGIDVKEIGLRKGNFISGTFQKNAQGKTEVVNISDGRYCASGVMDQLVVEKGECKTKPVVEATITYATTNHEWTNQDVNVTITYSESGVKLFKTTVSVTSNVNAVKCEAVNNGSYTCNGEATKNIEAGSWYQVEGNPVLTFMENGSVTAQIVEGSEYKVSSSFAVANIDKTGPVVATNGPGTLLYIPAFGSNQIVALAFCEDAESGIAKYEFSKDNGATWINNGTNATYTFEGLTQGSTYAIKMRCTNGAGAYNEATATQSTVSLTNPVINIVGGNSYPNGTANAMLEAKITYSNSNMMNQVSFYFKSTAPATVGSGVVIASCGSGEQPGACTNSSATTLVANTWYQTSSRTPVVTYRENGILYAVMNDGTNLSGTSTLSISGVGDTTAPVVDTNGPGNLIYIPARGSEMIAVVAFCQDTESGISKYEFSKDNGATWITSGSKSYTFNNLSQSTSYSLKVKCTNGAGLSTEGSMQTSTTALSTTIQTKSNQSYPNGGTAYQNVTLQITHESGASSIDGYFMSTAPATVDSGVVVASCGTGGNPGACTTSNATVLKANTWYQTKRPVHTITLTQNGSVYAYASDGINVSGRTSVPVSNIGDTTAPVLSHWSGNLVYFPAIESTQIGVVANCADAESGISKYEFSKDNGVTWINTEGASSYTFRNLTPATSYTFKVRCTNGAGLSIEDSKSTSTR